MKITVDINVLISATFWLDDNKILECDSTGEVDFIITNNSHLLNLKEFDEVRIISPNEFLKNL